MEADSSKPQNSVKQLKLNTESESKMRTEKIEYLQKTKQKIMIKLKSNIQKTKTIKRKPNIR